MKIPKIPIELQFSPSALDLINSFDLVYEISITVKAPFIERFEKSYKSVLILHQCKIFEDLENTLIEIIEEIPVPSNADERELIVHAVITAKKKNSEIEIKTNNELILIGENLIDKGYNDSFPYSTAGTTLLAGYGNVKIQNMVNDEAIKLYVDILGFPKKK